MREIRLRPINDIIAEVRQESEREARREIERIRQQTEERIRAIELNRQALASLDGAGIDLSLPAYSKGAVVSVDLGFFPHTKIGNRQLADKVRTIRQALDCRLEQSGKEVGDAKKRTVRFTLKPVAFPNIRIHFERRLPKGAKCRIVRQRSSYASLVCEV